MILIWEINYTYLNQKREFYIIKQNEGIIKIVFKNKNYECYEIKKVNYTVYFKVISFINIKII